VTERRRGDQDVIRTVLDDGTVERLRVEAEARGIDVEQLIVELLVAASQRIDDLLPRNGADHPAPT
jgi:hypothetical protein